LNVLVFTPHNPHPVRSGAHRRILEMLRGLRDAGARVTLAGVAGLSTENRWSAEASRWLEENGLCESVTVLDEPLPTFSEKLWRRLTKAAGPTGTPPTLDLATPRMRAWFAALTRARRFDWIFVNYAGFAGLLPSALRTRGTILETHDLVTLHGAMRAKLEAHLPVGPVFSPDAVGAEALELSFARSSGIAAHPLEFEAIDRFDVTLAISEEEAGIMRDHTRHTIVHTIGTPISPAQNRRPHGPLALFPMGPHTFNLQGYAWFVRRVLPLIEGECPDFCLGVSGFYHTTLEYHPRVRILGFVADATQLWSLGRMLVNPNYAGTGQPIKTIEGMAAGLPAVILKHFSGGAPIQHAVSGFIANDEVGFAEYCVRLWRDPSMCWDMGTHAMSAVEKECSPADVARTLGCILQSSATSRHEAGRS